MILKVVYLNPNPSGSNVFQFENVIEWRTDHGELQIYISDSGHPDVIFAAKQWVCAEMHKEAQDDVVGSTHESIDRVRAVDAKEKDTNASRKSGLPRRSASTDSRSTRRQSDLTDLAFPTPEAVEYTRAASVEFAIDNRKVPWSEAHMRSVLEYEQLMRDEYGEEAVRNLPWNRIPRAGDNR